MNIDGATVPAYPELHEPARRVTPLTKTRDHYLEQLDKVKGNARQREADEARRAFEDALAAHRLDGVRLKAPPAREQRAQRFGGGRHSRNGEYDWFWELAPDERARVRDNWMTSSSSAQTPDEVEAAGVPIDEWLALTRGIDAAKAVRTGRHLQAKRYGGRDPLAYLGKVHPDELEGRVERFHARRGGTHHSIERAAGVQFFTDENGIVHPIRASYEGEAEYHHEADVPPYVTERGDEAF